jgi:hypothetical protein
VDGLARYDRSAPACASVPCSLSPQSPDHSARVAGPVQILTTRPGLIDPVTRAGAGSDPLTLNVARSAVGSAA